MYMYVHIVQCVLCKIMYIIGWHMNKNVYIAQNSHLINGEVLYGAVLIVGSGQISIRDILKEQSHEFMYDISKFSVLIREYAYKLTWI